MEQQRFSITNLEDLTVAQRYAIQGIAGHLLHVTGVMIRLEDSSAPLDIVAGMEDYLTKAYPQEVGNVKEAMMRIAAGLPASLPSNEQSKV